MPAGQPYSVTPRGVGLPDYSVAKPVGQVPVGSVYTSTDIAELASRLGSIVTLDRRGNVFWFDDFEDGLAKWSTGADLPLDGGSVSLSTAQCRVGSTSCKLNTAPTFATCKAYMVTYLASPAPPPSISRLGFELAFTKLSFHLDPEIWFILVYYDQTTAYQGFVKYKQSTHGLYFVDALGNDIKFADNILIAEATTIFHMGKLVIDPTENKYVRFLLDGVEYQLDQYPLLTWPDVVSPSLEVRIRLQNTGLASSTSYIDTVIMTHNEPANS